MRILHIEDQKLHHDSIRKMLENIFGDELALEWRETHADGLSSIQYEEYDLVILDYVLDDGTAADILKEVDAPNLPTTFIVISAFDEHRFDVTALQLGADDYLIKGRFDERELRRAIDYASYRKDKMQSLNRLAFFDHLTHLPNRHYLKEHTQKAVHMSTRVGRFVGVYYIDMDGFKAINDVHGHKAGDKVLEATGMRLTDAIRKTDTAVRLGGDEFLVVSPGITRPKYVQEVAVKLEEALTQPVEFEGKTLKPGCSIGMAMIPGDADDLNGAIAAADKAMYKVKQAHKARGGQGAAR